MSKFDKIFEARGGADEKTESETAKEVKKTFPKPKDSGKSARGAAKTKETKAHASQKTETAASSDGSRTISQKKRGRPQAKRSDPNYVGFTTYIRKDTHLKAKIALLQEGQGKELSELVEELIGKWLKSK